MNITNRDMNITNRDMNITNRDMNITNRPSHRQVLMSTDHLFGIFTHLIYGIHSKIIIR